MMRSYRTYTGHVFNVHATSDDATFYTKHTSSEAKGRLL